MSHFLPSRANDGGLSALGAEYGVGPDPADDLNDCGALYGAGPERRPGFL